MNIADEIASILAENPDGLKASEIATRIGCTRKNVNSYLYAHKGMYEQHEGYIWTAKSVQKKMPHPACAQQPLPESSNSVSIQQTTGNTVVSTLTITPNGDSYCINSTNNQIICCDCKKFFSIHAQACPFCGCPLHFVADKYFKQFRVDAAEQRPRFNRIAEPPRQSQPQKTQNREEEKKKCERLVAIRTMSNYYIGSDIDIETTSLETLTDIYSNVAKRQELIKSVPTSAELFIQKHGIELHMLSTQTLELVLNRCAEYFAQESSSGYALEEQADTLFREAVLSRINCDAHTLAQLRTLYNKYAKIYKGDKETFQLTVVDINGTKHQIDVTFFGTLRSYFRKKSEELFRQAYPGHFRLVDPVKGLLFIAYGTLANVNIGPSYVKEISSHKEKMLSAEAARKLLCDIDWDKGLLYRSIELTCDDTIVEAENLSHEHASEKVFLLVGIYDESDNLITKRVLGVYCKSCKRYYVTHSVFLELVTKGRVNAKLLTAELSEYDYDDGNIFSSFSPESLLRKCGYTVNANDALSDEKRQKILKSVIDNRLYSPSGIISHLSFLISISQKVETRDMKYAIQKWTRDIDYIKQNYVRR